MVCLHAGVSRVPSPVPWEALCDDARRKILNKLALKDLARAAGTCREYRKAYHTKLAQERADRIAVASASFLGFDVLVNALRRFMHGHHPFPSMPDKPYGVVTPHCSFHKSLEIFLSSNGVPKYVMLDERLNESPKEPCAFIGKRYAYLVLGGLAVGPCFRPTFASLFKCKGEKWKVEMDEEAVVATVGVLIANFTENPTAEVGSFRSPFRMDFGIRGRAGGLPRSGAPDLAALMCRLEDVVAPLRSSAKSVTISNVSNGSRHFCM